MVKQPKYFRPLEEILTEVVAGINMRIDILSAVQDPDTLITVISCCNIYYAQKGYVITIEGKQYKIKDFSQAQETLTLEPQFTGAYTIDPGTSFYLYGLQFFHGTPITTDTELKAIEFADEKVPMIWLWENYEEDETEDELIERVVPVELYALTQAPDQLQAMTHENITIECVNPMRRALACLKAQIFKRSDLFSTDFFKSSYEAFHKFGVIARKKGSEKKLMADFLSGCAMYTTLELWYKDSCRIDQCEFVPKAEGIGAMAIGSTFIVS